MQPFWASFKSIKKSPSVLYIWTFLHLFYNQILIVFKNQLDISGFISSHYLRWVVHTHTHSTAEQTQTQRESWWHCTELRWSVEFYGPDLFSRCWWIIQKNICTIATEQKRHSEKLRALLSHADASNRNIKPWELLYNRFTPNSSGQYIFYRCCVQARFPPAGPGRVPAFPVKEPLVPSEAERASVCVFLAWICWRGPLTCSPRTAAPRHGLTGC